MVASPAPQRIFGLEVITLLVIAGVTVICAGGCGIPVVRTDDGGYSGVEAVIDKDHASAPTIKNALVRRAKSHGIVVTETGIAADMMEFEVIQRLLFESGRPVLVVPRAFNTEISLTTVLVAWDGSENATRAFWNALPVIGLSSRIVICFVKGEKTLDDDAGAKELAASLQEMGINAEVTALELQGKTVADTLLSEAETLSAGIVVLGAYGHSRWREFVFGGVTRDMLRFSKIPMFMSN